MLKKSSEESKTKEAKQPEKKEVQKQVVENKEARIKERHTSPKNNKMDIAQLQHAGMPELFGLARELNINGISGLKKQDLIYQILDYRHSTLQLPLQLRKRNLTKALNRTDNAPKDTA